MCKVPSYNSVLSKLNLDEQFRLFSEQCKVKVANTCKKLVEGSEFISEFSHGNKSIKILINESSTVIQQLQKDEVKITQDIHDIEAFQPHFAWLVS